MVGTRRSYGKFARGTNQCAMPFCVSVIGVVGLKCQRANARLFELGSSRFQDLDFRLFSDDHQVVHGCRSHPKSGMIVSSEYQGFSAILSIGPPATPSYVRGEIL